MRKIHHLPRLGALLGAVLAFGISQSLSGEEMLFSTIGNPGNPPDVNGYGAVQYPYRVQQTRVKNEQYAHFLNSVDPKGTGDRGLYHSNMEASPKGGIVLKADNPPGQRYVVKEGYASRPVAFVSWQDAARYTNWLNNGATHRASTEKGAYDMAKAKEGYVERSPGARFWIPSRNELYKASFYKPAEGQNYTREPQLPEVAAGGKVYEIVDYSDRTPQATLLGVAENAAQETVAFNEKPRDACEEVSEDGFRVACRVNDAAGKECQPVEEVSEVGEIISSYAPSYFLTSPFSNPAGPVREARPEETPEPSPTPRAGPVREVCPEETPDPSPTPVS